LIDAEAPAAGPPGPGGGDSGISRPAGAALASPAYTSNAGGAGLSNRLNALARLVQIGSARAGQEGFDARLLADAEALLARAGERLRLSAHHTIVVSACSAR